MTKTLVVAAIFLCALGAYEALAQDADPRTSFFLTSVGPGKGADLGGLAGADQYCQNLAESVGVGNKTWHAYLTTTGQGAVNAPGSHRPGALVQHQRGCGCPERR